MTAVADSEGRKMDLVVRCLYKTLVLNGVDGASDIADLKEMLHLRGVQEHIPIPVASKQRLVHKGNVLSIGSLQQAGIRSGDHLVLLFHRANTTSSVKPVDTTPVPTAATIRNAIIDEARRRGLEHTIMDEPRRAPRAYGMPMEAMALEVDNQLLQLIQALQNRTQAAAGRGAQQQQPRAEGAAGGGPAPGQQQQAEAGAARVPRYLQPPAGGPLPGLMPFRRAAPPPPPAAPAPMAIPEPDAQAASQLRDMGFGEAVVRKSLLLHRNELEAALNWLLQHGDDPAAAEPLTDEQLRQIYSRGPRGPPSEPELVEQLVAMGFDRNRSASALRRFRNMDLTLAYLLRAAEEEGADGQQGGGAGGQGSDAAAGAEPAPRQQQEQAGAGGQGGVEGERGQQQGAGDAAAAGGRGGGHGTEAGGGVGAGQQQQHDAPPPQPMEVEHEEEHGEDDEEEDDDEDDEENEDEGLEDDDDDEFTGDEEDMPSMIEQLAAAGGGRGAALRIPIGGGALGIGGGPMPEDVMGGYGGPFVLYGGAPHGMSASAPVMAVTRGPDGNELVLGAAGASMPPLMPARGVLIGQSGAGGMGGGGGPLGPGAQLVDLPEFLQLQGGDAGDDEMVMQGVGLVQQLLNAVLRDALNGGEAGANAGGRNQQR